MRDSGAPRFRLLTACCLPKAFDILETRHLNKRRRNPRARSPKMEFLSARSRWHSPAILVGVALLVVACGSKEPPADAASKEPPADAASQAAASNAADQASTIPASGVTSWSPEALEELLAPIALYPDPVLSQVLIASTNPQEVLDAGNWLLDNQGLSGKALDDAATKVGFTPPIRALVNFPDTLDMMCREMDWTTQLGEAFTADQAGVLDAVQRLRKQAESAGNLQTSPQMTVDNQTQDGKEVIVLQPASSGEVYVPSYDPVAVYAPPPATAVAPATTTTTTTTESTGHSTGTLVATGLLSFGAGMLVSELFDDDDDYDDYRYPNYGYGGMPYYPPYPYRPAYGNGHYPSNGYRPPGGYGGRYGGNNVNTGNVIINTGGSDYFDRYDGRGGAQNRRNSSPITAANPKRSDLNELNKRQPRPMPADAKRPSTKATASDWKGENTYGGAAKTPAASNRSAKTGAGPSGQAQRPAPKVQGSYKGGSSASNRDVTRPSTGATSGTNRGAAGQSTYQGNKSGGADRGYQQQASRQQPSKQQASRQQPSKQQASRQQPSKQQASRPQQQASRPAAAQKPAKQGGSHSTATSGANRGTADRQASNRGKQSMPQGAHSKGGGGKGGKSGGGKSGGGKKR
jgi:hypothetical protein